MLFLLWGCRGQRRFNLRHRLGVQPAAVLQLVDKGRVVHDTPAEARLGLARCAKVGRDAGQQFLLGLRHDPHR
jgi:hypothetical protein